MSYVLMAYIVMAYVLMAYIVMAHIVMADIVMAQARQHHRSSVCPIVKSRPRSTGNATCAT